MAAGGPVLDLAKGHPDPSLLPHQALADACAATSTELRTGSIQGLAYGSRPEGSVSFARELAAFIARQCPGEQPVRAEDGLLLTNGVSHGLELAASVLARPGDAVLVEAPNYFLASGIFKSHGLEIVPVPTDASGLVVEDIEGILDARPAGSAPVRLLYTIPASHNPTGVVLPSVRRQALVDMARRRGIHVLADEVYHMLDWHEPGRRPPRMVCFDEAYTGIPQGGAAQDNPNIDPIYDAKDGSESPEDAGLAPVVISVNSFTKILAPGLRVGWVEAAPPLVKKLAKRGYLVSGGCVATFAADAVLRHALEQRGVDAALKTLASAFSERSARLAAALQSVGLRPLAPPSGGYFIWVPLGMDAEAVLTLAKERHGVTFMPGSRCDASANPALAQCARLCFALLSAEQLEEGVRRLAAALQAAKAEAEADAPSAKRHCATVKV